MTSKLFSISKFNHFVQGAHFNSCYPGPGKHGFSLAKPGIQTKLIIASQSTTIHNRVINMYVALISAIPRNFNCNSLFVP